MIQWKPGGNSAEISIGFPLTIYRILMNNIYLTGFMGAGKTSGGRMLAERLGLNFLDLDEWIEQQEGQSIAVIFREKGEAAFRQIEAECLRKTAGLSNLIVATGGGTPCFFDNMDWMNGHGVTVYLQASATSLALRLKPETEKRPLLANLSDEEMITAIELRLSEREHFYEKAHIAVNTDTGGLMALEELCTYLKRFLRF